MNDTFQTYNITAFAQDGMNRESTEAYCEFNFSVLFVFVQSHYLYEENQIVNNQLNKEMCFCHSYSQFPPL